MSSSGQRKGGPISPGGSSGRRKGPSPTPGQQNQGGKEKGKIPTTAAKIEGTAGNSQKNDAKTDDLSVKDKQLLISLPSNVQKLLTESDPGKTIQQNAATFIIRSMEAHKSVEFEGDVIEKIVKIASPEILEEHRKDFRVFMSKDGKKVNIADLLDRKKTVIEVKVDKLSNSLDKPKEETEMEKKRSKSPIKSDISKTEGKEQKHENENQLERQVSDMEKKLKAREIELKEKDIELKEKDKKMEEKDKKIEDKDKKIEEKEKKIEEKEEKLRVLQEKNKVFKDEAKAICKRYDERIKKLENGIDEKQDMLRTMEENLEKSHSENKVLEDKRMALQMQYQDSQFNLEKANNENKNLDDELMALKMQYRESEYALKKANRTADILKEHYEDTIRHKDNQFKELLADRDDLRQRFSKKADVKWTDQNPDIADLSDPNRAMKLSEKFGELYDDQWTDAFEWLTSNKKLQVKDAISLLLDVLRGALFMVSEESKVRNHTLQIYPHYFACQGREVNVIHESGIVLYDTTSNSIPVGQLIGVKPLTKENDNFSIRILAIGENQTIAMGIGPQNYSPNHQPGWNKQSIGYHADDGGIYLEYGSPSRETLKCKEGDIMSFYADFTRNKGFFRKNGEKMIELKLNFNKLACYPMIGFHSIGEAVQILEKDMWTPKTEQERANNLPPAFTTYEYRNLWISPGDEVNIKKLKANQYFGWVVLHNPTKDPVGFKISSEGEKGLKHFGKIDYKKDWLGNLKFDKDNLPSTITVQWASLESGRTYTDDGIKILFSETPDQLHQSIHEHKLSVKVIDSDKSKEQLSKESDGTPSDKGLKEHARIKSTDKKAVRELRGQIGVNESVLEEVKQMFVLETKSWPDKKLLDGCLPYVQKCAEICWLMVLHDPPLYMKMDVKPGDTLDPNLYSVYSASGNKIDFLVWPPLFNEKDGGLLSKGTAETTKVVKMPSCATGRLPSHK